jgi:hypothetical protein
MAFLRIGKNKKVDRHFYCGLVVLWVCYAHYIFYRQNSVFYANDYLELVVPWFKHLVDKRAVFADNNFMIPGMLSELPRGLFPSEFYLETWLYMALDPFPAILTNKFLIHTTAYVSAFHFLTSLNFEIAKRRVMLYSVCWSTLGFWEGAGIGASAIPSLIYVFCILYEGGRLKVSYVFFLAVYGCYSYLHLHGLFFIGLFLVLGVLGLRQRIILANYSLALGALCLFYLLFNYRLVDIYFFQREWFTPHRVEYDIHSFAAYHNHLLRNSLKVLFTGADHSIKISPVLVLTTVFLAFRRASLSSDTWERSAQCLLLVSALVSFLSMGSKYLPLIEVFPLLQNLSQFSYDRFSFFVAPLTFFAFVILMEKNFNLKTSQHAFNLIIFVVVAYHVLVINDTLRNKIVKPLTGMGEMYATFEGFYAVDLFREVKLLLDEESEGETYLAGSMGIHPAVAIYNNIPSIDGYAGIYSLEYKRMFSRFIQKELEGSELAAHFFGWGNKCYLFNTVQGDDFVRWKWRDRVVVSPKYDYEFLYSQGCRFLISTDPIHGVPHIELLKVLDHSESAWVLHIYKLKDEVGP